MKLYFKKIESKAKFLPLHVAKSMPIGSDKLQVILRLCSLPRDIEITMKRCEEKGVKDEEKYCANSLETMVDYVTSNLDLGKNKLVVLSTEQDNGILMDYTIQKVQKLERTDIYDVSLVGADGKQTKAMVGCHKDTSTWNPRHYAFQFLKTVPGGKPICHFVNADAIAWILN
ncbi:BURP domain-containing protein 3 [Bienertia sinuspersici]